MKANECKYEVWKPIRNFNNYEVSTFGRVRSIPRKVHTWNGERKVKGKILNTRLNKGYLYVLMRDNNNKVRNMKVHRLVALSFIPNPHNYPQVNHKDGNKSNNNVDNLEWRTAKENTYHAVVTGLLKSGDKSHRTVIHKSELIEVYGLSKLGLTHKQIAKMFNVEKSTISAIFRSKRYLKDYVKEDFERKVSDFVKDNKGRYIRCDKRTINHNGFPWRSIIQKDKDGNTVCEFESIAAASKANNVLPTSITNNLKGRSKTCGGYIYEYKNY